MSNQKNSDNKSNKKQNTKNMKINEWPRHGIQALWAFITNSHVTGFVTGKIYTGKLKNACVPGLNCYSCPGAVGACPIGSLQAVIGSWNFKMAYYVVGFLIFIGAMVGRLICGFLCPFGLIQDLLNKIPFPKKIRTFRGDKLLRKLKYVIFLVFVILLPMFVVDIMGQGAPYFCKLICPAGTLEGGIPLVLLKKRRPLPCPAASHRYAVLIAARNEENVIAGLLDSLAAQTYDMSLVTVFVAADNCTGTTPPPLPALMARWSMSGSTN